MMEIFKKKEQSSQQIEPEPLPVVSSKTQGAWWQVFTNALYRAVGDMEELLTADQGEVAKKMASAARKIADAAIEEYEDRFTL